ncbi:MAG: pinensin family lanthipeptide [Bacteroidota bacterium]
MKKLKLNLDEIKIESFETSSTKLISGTVHAQVSEILTDCPIPTGPGGGTCCVVSVTREPSCGNTYCGTCQELTCAGNTCEQTCYATDACYATCDGYTDLPCCYSADWTNCGCY